MVHVYGTPLAQHPTGLERPTHQSPCVLSLESQAYLHVSAASILIQ